MLSAGRNIAAACLFTFATVTSAQNSARVESCRPGVWALTFDDGPSEHTPTLLKVLETAGVKATFFVLGSQLEDATNAERMKQAFKAGHQIASHTYSHQSLSNMDEATITKEMKDTDAKIKAAIGQSPNYMRPPFGECANSCEPTMAKLGYTIAVWNIDSQDWRYASDPAKQDQLVEDIKRYLDGKGPVAKSTDPQGVVSLQHDIHAFSIERTPKIIEYIKSQGFTFATVAECGKDGDRPGPYRNGGAGKTSKPEPATPAAPAAQPEQKPNTTVVTPNAYDSGVKTATSEPVDPTAKTVTGDGQYTTGYGENATTVSGGSSKNASTTSEATTVSGGSSKSASTTSETGKGNSTTNKSDNSTTTKSDRNSSSSVRNTNAVESSADVVCRPGQFAAWTAAGLFGLTKLF